MYKCLYISATEHWGGGEVYLANLVNSLHKMVGEKFSPILLGATHGEATSKLRDCTPYVRVHLSPMRYPFLILSFIRLCKIIKQQHVPVVHINGRRPLIFVVFLKLLWPKLRVVATLHTPFFNDVDLVMKSRLLSLLHFSSLHMCDKIFVVSHEIRNELLGMFRLCPEKVDVILNGVDLTRFDPTAKDVVEKVEQLLNKLRIPARLPLILQVSRIEEFKGQKLLLDVVSSLIREGNELGLIFVGSGTFENTLRKMVVGKGLEHRVYLCGYQDDVVPYLHASNVVVLPSLSEGMPYSILEAMAAGKPVIASNVGELPYVIEDGKTGFLVAPRDTETLKHKIQLLLNSPSLSVSMGKAARQWIKNNASSLKMAKAVAERGYGWRLNV